MSPGYLTDFNQRQEMLRNDFEIFHYFDSASCDVALHSHPFYEIYCLLDGRMDYIVSGRSYTLLPGTLLLIAPGEMHRPDIRAKDQTFDRVVFWMSEQFFHSLSTELPRLVQTISGAARSWNLLSPDPSTYQVLRGLLFSLLYEKELSDANSMFMSRLIVTQLLVHLSRFLSKSPMAAPAKQEIRYTATMKIYDFINAHFREEIGVAALAERFYMDKNTLNRQFKHYVGLTPGEYIRRRRLENAHTLISRGIGAQTAGYQSGFGDYSAFYRAFRQEYGISPSTLAARYKETKEDAHGE